MAKSRRLSISLPRLLLIFVAVVICWTTISSERLNWVLQELQPIEQSSHIPKKIWQIWLHSVSTKHPDRDWGNLSYSWVDQNPDWDYVYAVMNDTSAEKYVQDAFKHRKDVVEAFIRANETIHKADFLRYLLLLEQGGVYSDLDTRCAKHVDDWIPVQYRNTTGLVIGIELNDYFSSNYDPDRPYIQLCQWTIMARPHHPTMAHVVDSVTARLLGWEGEDVMDMTGPRVFTEAVFESLSKRSGRDNEVLRDEVADITAPYQTGDVLILPINAFGSGQLHSGSKKPEECDPFVVHSFAGSWRPKRLSPGTP